MRRRSVVLTSAVAAAVVVLPGSAAAAPAQCSLVVPAKVVVDRPLEEIPVRLSSNCTASGADHAYWDVVNHRGWGWQVDFEATDIAEGTTAAVLEHGGTDPVGIYRGYGVGAEQADGDALTQNAPVMAVKYGAKLRLSGTSKRGMLTLTATASTWSGKAGRWYPRAGAQVQVLKHKSGNWWVWVRNATTNSSGRVNIPTGFAHTGDVYRVRIVETNTVWASGSGHYRVP